MTAAADRQAVYRVGVYENPPKIFFREPSGATGFFPDLLQVVADQNGFGIEPVVCEWAECLARLESGEIDIMPDVAWTGEREKRFRFGRETALHSWSTIYTSGGVTVERLAELAGKRVAVLEDSVQHRRLIELQRSRDLSFSILTTPTHLETLAVVDRGDANVGIVNQYFGYAHEADFAVTRMRIVFQPSRLFFAYAPGVPGELITAMDAAIALLKSDPYSVYYHLTEKWISPPSKQFLPVWAYWVGAGLIVSLLGFLAVGHYLRVEVQNRTADLASALKQAEEANAAKGRFLAHMSHELRTPLNAIIGFADLIVKLGPDRLGNERVSNYSRDIGTSGARLLEIVNDVLSFSQLEETGGELPTRSERVVATVDAAISALSSRIAEKGIEVHVDVAAEAEAVFSSAAMRQCLINVLSNAVKFSPEGGAIWISAKEMDGELRIRVRDAGEGIEQGLLSKIGDAFVHGGDPVVASSEGTGLGLAITKRLLDQQHGHLRLSSGPGEGTTVEITVPAA